MEPAGKRIIPAEDDDASRKRTMGRLYIACQAAVWGGPFTVSVLVFIRDFANFKPDSFFRLHPLWTVFVGQDYPCVAGFLLTHFSRRLMERWGWKRLDRRALMPRIFGMAIVLGLVWIAGFFVIQHYCFPVQSRSPQLRQQFFFSWSVGSLVFAVWLGAYFLYHVFERFNRSERDSLRLAAKVKEAELQALKSQVNPHFIFNSLNSLRSLIEEDPVRARLAVTQLANLLRYSLQGSQQATVPFEEELRIAKDYLALEQVRYESRLRVSLDVADEALRVPVPPMVLQTLVENAVKFGVAGRPDGGEVRISAAVVQGRLRLRVASPGALSEEVAASGKSTGVGLRNSAERLRLLFGPQAELWLRSESPGIVMAEAFVPLLPEPAVLP
jgi:sensor histidine kinase YesM